MHIITKVVGLAATETNMAYRAADYERWQQLDFVVGIRIELSNNHTCLGADGKPHRFHDICDDLQKKYPELPNTEKAAIFHYTKGDGAAFRHLYKQLREGNLTEFNEAFSQLLSQGLAKLETTSGTVYRTLRLNKTKLMEYLSLAEEQEVTTFAGFTSTSVEKQVALDMVKK